MAASVDAELSARRAPVGEPVAGNYFVAAYPPFSAWQPAQVSAWHDAPGQPAPAPDTSLGPYIHSPFCRKKCDHRFRLSYVVSACHTVKDPQRHRYRNQDCLWRGMDMLGLGAAAFGYFGGVHAQNEVTLEQNQAAVGRGEFPVKRAFKLSAHDRLDCPAWFARKN